MPARSHWHPRGEVGELARVAQRRAVAEARQARTQLGEAPRGEAVARRVWCEHVGRLVQPGYAGAHVDVVEHVAEDQHAVGFAPVGDVAARVPRGLEHGEAGDLVTLDERARNGVRRPGPEAALE